MIEALLGNLWPLITGALGLVAVFFGMKSKVHKGQAEKAKQDAVNARIEAKVARSDADIAEEMLRKKEDRDARTRRLTQPRDY